MIRTVLLVGTTSFWLLMTSLLIQKEYFEASSIQASYEILPLDLETREEYHAISLGKERVGFGYSVLDAREQPKGTFELRHQSYMSFRFLGQEREILIRGKAKVDRQLNLREFELKISSGENWTKIVGKTEQKNMLLAIEGSEGSPAHKTIPMPEPVLYSEAINFIWTPDNLKLGKQGKLRLWNPLMMNFQEIRFHVQKKEKLLYAGKENDVLVVAMDMGGIETHAWITPTGIVLKQESPTGLTTQKEESWQSLQAVRKGQFKPPDLPNLYSISSNQVLENPEKMDYLKIKLEQPNQEKILEFKKDSLEGLENISLPVSVPADLPEMANYLATDEWVQSADPVIIQQAREIAGNEKNAWTASLKIADWVHQYILPTPTLSLPRAREVLATKKGDCNEYTILFTALARAIGIPTKMNAGLVYQNGRFFYHAWPSIYLNRWINLDPTFGQAPADVTHIPLVEANLQEQIALVNQLGRIKVFILSTEENKNKTGSSL